MNQLISNEMEEKVLEIVNMMRDAKGLEALKVLSGMERLREDIGFSSFDLAELTVRLEDEFGIDVFEDGLVVRVDEIYMKLSGK